MNDVSASDLASSYRTDIIVRRWFAVWIDVALVAFVVAAAGAASSSENVDPLVFVAVAHAVAFGYHTFLEGRFGITLGKWLAGVRVLDMNGGTPGLARGAIRTVFRLIEVNPLLFGGIPAGVVADFSRRRQRLGDMCAKTLVLKYRDLKQAFPESGPAQLPGPQSNFLEWGIRGRRR